ncbi:hypothetical protein Tco_0962636 [Tanacetum coccineum]
MMREWMPNQIEKNENMKNQVVELERRINQGLRNHQAIIQNLERQILRTESFPRTTNTKLRYEFVYKPPSNLNENDKGDVKFIEEDAIKAILTMPNPNLINSYSLTVSPFLKDYAVHIPYMSAKTFANDVLSNHVGDTKVMEGDAWRRNQLISHAYASFCVAFIIRRSIMISHARMSGFSLTLISLFLYFDLFSSIEGNA